MTDSVLITGASTGLGLETAVHLAERGFRVYATMRDLGKREPLDEEAARRGVNLDVLRLDVTDPPSIGEAVAAIVERSRGIFALVNNAGIGMRGYFEDVSDEEVRRVFETNVFGTMAVTRAVLPHMRAARRGRIVFLTSVGGKIGSMGVSAYCATRFAQEGFAESLAQEVQPLGVQVVIVEPGIVKTELWTSANRGVASGALDPGSPYSAWFRRLEAMTDQLAESSPTRPRHVAETVQRALTDSRPRMRYVVGRRAAFAVSLRRYAPAGLFERFYFGTAIRRVTRPEPR